MRLPRSLHLFVHIIRRQFERISVRLALVFVFLLIPMIVIDVVGLIGQLRIRRADAVRTTEYIAELVETEITGQFERTEAILTGFAKAFVTQPESTTGAENLAALEPTLKRIHARFPFYSAFTATNSQGFVAASSVPFRPTIYAAYTHEFKQAMQTGEIGYGRFFTSSLTGLPSLIISHPLLNTSGDIVGTVNASISMEMLEQRLNEIGFPDGYLVVVFDANGAVLAHRGDLGLRIGQRISEAFYTSVRDQVSGTASGPHGAISELGELSVLGAARKLEQVPGGVFIAVGVQTDIVMKPTYTTFLRQLVVVLLVIAGSFAAAWLLNRRLVLRPVNALRDYSTQIAKGRLDAPVPTLPMPTEFRPLMKSLEHMSSRLIDHDAELRALVAKRTHELEAARSRAEDASAAKNVFMASLSHEVRTPLNGLLGMLQLVDDAELSATQHEYISLARESGAHLLTLINDLLDLSRIEHRKLHLERQVFDVVGLTQRLGKEFQIEAERRSLALRCVTDKMPDRLLVEGDPTRVRQILSNLLINALKFTDEGHVELQLESTESMDHDIGLHFNVRDTGNGISPERLDGIFELFSQAADDAIPPHTGGTDRRTQGTGLGLTISRELARLMNGDISVESTVGEGSCFTVTLELPLAQDHEAPAADTHDSRVRRLRILVVEDERISAKVMNHMLDRLGHSCEICSDGSSALNRLRNGSFDCVLTDIHLPDMNGLELLQQIRSSNAAGIAPDTPVISVSAHAMPEHIQSFLDAGMNAYLTKPVQLDELTAVLERV